MGDPDRLAWIVAGPTASGKSALATWLARRVGGTVINADAMQVYRELRIVTARPTEAEERAVPHALYGVRPAAEPGSAAWWRTAALAEMAACDAAGRVPVLCGGTGLYLSALTRGLSDIPEPSPAIRDEARRRLSADGSAVLHAALAAVDPGTAAGLRPSDGQRIARAWEVWRSTGRGLVAWQSTAIPAPWAFRVLRLDPPRDALRSAVATRFAAMLDAGALDEVACLLALELDPALPAMRAVGVPELAAHLRHETTLETARHLAVLATGQLVKRQSTWLRHRALASPAHTHTIHAQFAGLTQYSESRKRDLMLFVDAGGMNPVSAAAEGSLS